MSYLYNMLVGSGDAAVDCSQYDTLSGIEAVCDVPDGHSLFFAFQIGEGYWQKYDFEQKAWTDINGEFSAEAVSNEGNTLDEILKLDRSALFPFIGNQVCYAIVSKVDQSKVGVPVIRSFSFVDDSVPCGNAIKLGDGNSVEITGISPDVKIVGDGACTIIASVQSDDGKWSGYSEYHKYMQKQTLAKAIKFRAIRSIKTVDEDSVTIDSISVAYRNRGKGWNLNTVLVTNAFSFPNPISTVHMILKHPDADDVEFHPKVSFRDADTDPEHWIPLLQDRIEKNEDTGLLTDEFDYTAKEEDAGTIVTLRVDMHGNTGSVENKTLGIGTGAPTLYKLEHAAIRNSISVTPVEATWDYDFQKRTISVTATAGKPIYINYDWEAEMTYLDSISCTFSE